MRAQKKTLFFCRSYKADRPNLGPPLFLDPRDGKNSSIVMAMRVFLV